MSSVLFTLDLEDHRPDEHAEIRFPAVTDELLDDLDAWGVTGTVFVVGSVVASHPMTAPTPSMNAAKSSRRAPSSATASRR